MTLTAVAEGKVRSLNVYVQRERCILVKGTLCYKQPCSKLLIAVADTKVLRGQTGSTVLARTCAVNVKSVLVSVIIIIIIILIFN